jgi:hypothetical protein
VRLLTVRSPSAVMLGQPARWRLVSAVRLLATRSPSSVKFGQPARKRVESAVRLLTALCYYFITARSPSVVKLGQCRSLIEAGECGEAAHCAEPFVSRSPSHLHRLRDLRAGRLLSVCSPSAVTPWQAARSRVTSAVRPLSARSTSLVTLQPARLSVVRLLLALPALCY